MQWWSESYDIYEKSLPGKGNSKSKTSRSAQKDKSSKNRRNEEDRSGRWVQRVRQKPEAGHCKVMALGLNFVWLEANENFKTRNDIILF